MQERFVPVLLVVLTVLTAGCVGGGLLTDTDTGGADGPDDVADEVTWESFEYVVLVDDDGLVRYEH